MDIAQLPNLPEKTSESSESSDSESESKENSGRLIIKKTWQVGRTKERQIECLESKPGTLSEDA